MKRKENLSKRISKLSKELSLLKDELYEISVNERFGKAKKLVGKYLMLEENFGDRENPDIHTTYIYVKKSLDDKRKFLCFVIEETCRGYNIFPDYEFRIIELMDYTEIPKESFEAIKREIWVMLNE